MLGLHLRFLTLLFAEDDRVMMTDEVTNGRVVGRHAQKKLTCSRQWRCNSTGLKTYMKHGK
jgi:hypothetical protein